MRYFSAQRFAVGIVIWTISLACSVHADEFTYFDREGEKQTVTARLVGSDQGFFALEMADGQMLLVPEGTVEERVPGDDPEPLSADKVAATLTETFGGAEKVIIHVDHPHILVYIPHEPITDKRERVRKANLLKDADLYLHSMERKFSEHVRYYHLDDQPFRFPLITIIFETDEDFEDYTRTVTANEKGLSAGAIAGFYDSLSNYLVLRESECATFAVPLHESIHQQAFNRQIVQRMAPVPIWFHEGLANAFEGDGKTVKKGPKAVNDLYCQAALSAQAVTWDEIVRNDRSFQSEQTAGEAYGHAWALHWLLVVNHRKEYGRYVKYLSQLKPLEMVDERERVEQLETAIGSSVDDLYDEFLVRIRSVLKRINRRGSSLDRPTTSPETMFVGRGPRMPFITRYASLRLPPTNSAPVEVRQERESRAARFDITRYQQSDVDFSVPVRKRWLARRP